MLALALAAAVVGCGRSVLLPVGEGGGLPDGDDCPSGIRRGGVCVGVTAVGRCHDEPWLTAMSCDDVVSVKDEAGLVAALAKASSGACIDLASGSYGQHVVPPGVSLLGRGWDCVTLGELRMASGVVRGVTAAGLVVETGDVAISEVQLAGELGGATDGVRIEGGASASLRHLSISQSDGYGIAAFDSGDLSIDAVHVLDPRGPGLWAQCGAMPGQCVATKTPVSVRRSHLEGAAVVGMSLVNVAATLDDVVVAGSVVGNDFEAGGNLSVVNATLDARGLVIRDAADFGILVHDSEAILGVQQGGGVDVTGNLRGIWIQGAASDVALANAAISDNLGVGLGIDAGATVAAIDVTILDTRNIALPVLIGGVSAGSVEVGDGLFWGGGASVQLGGVVVGGSDRVPILIDGSVGPASSLTDITLVDGDAAVGIVHQNLLPGGIVPLYGVGVPEPKIVTSGEPYPVPGP